MLKDTCSVGDSLIVFGDFFHLSLDFYKNRKARCTLRALKIDEAANIYLGASGQETNACDIVVHAGSGSAEPPDHIHLHSA
ncbi:hypothetical protein Hdeb2414_s0004g00148821 [Helianthus debilis subsp. tardiflorus]